MQKNQFTLDYVMNNQHYYFNHDKITLEQTKELLLQDFSIYHIEELTFEDQAPRKEAFENVLSSLRIEGICFLYLIVGDRTGVHFYFGVVRDLHENQTLPLSISDIGEQILEPSLRGNFRGSKINEVDPHDKNSIQKTLQSFPYIGYLEGVPGINEDSEDFQGVDRLIDVMQGDEFALAIISKPLMQSEIHRIEKDIHHAYSSIAPFAKTTVQEGNSTGTNEGRSKTTNQSDSTGKSLSEGKTTSESTNTSQSDGTSKTTTKGTSKNNSSSSESKSGAEGSTFSQSTGQSSSESIATTKGTSHSKTIGESVSENNGLSKSENQTVSVEFTNREAQDWLKYLDEVILPRLDYGKSKGIFLTTSFLLTNNKGNLLKLGNTMRSLFSGKSGNKVPLIMKTITNEKIIDSVKNFQFPIGKINSISLNERYARSAISHFVSNEKIYLGNWMSTHELSTMAGLPQKEIVGLSLKEEVEFGLNFDANIPDDKKIVLGNLVQSGTVLENIEVPFHKDHLNKHIFITGVTGSGKTTTCQKLLLESGLPFLVIEPAKTEYRILQDQFQDLLIFTIGKNTAAPFRLNPFEFFEHESITSRVDMIKASLEASFDMEAAIPQILEKAIYECYEDYGWNIATNKNRLYPRPFDDGIFAFPTLEDLVRKIESVVVSQGFDDRLKNDYIGSIKARLQGLLLGAKGLMLNTKRSIDFETLIENRVVLELEEIKSGSEKSLIMGFILTNLTEAIKAKFFKSKDFKHITLVEEAHRLLSKFTPGDSLNKKQGVEVFSDMLAEVRKYGESLIIVDQIPDKLTPEVLKNTNTKIVHKIFARDDKEAIGNTMALEDEQKEFLSNLEVGRAIMFTQGWSKAIQVKIQQKSNTTGDRFVSDDELREKILHFYQNTYKRGVLQGLESLPTQPEISFLEHFLEFIQGDPFISEYQRFVSKLTTSFPFKSHLEQLLSMYDLDLLADLLAKKYYREEIGFSLEDRKKSIMNLLEDILQSKISTRLGMYADELKLEE